MKCKVFSIRTNPEHLADDEDNLNRFLQNVKLSRVLASPIVGSDIWSLLVFYEEAVAKSRREVEDVTLSAEEDEIYVALRAWRTEQAKKEGIASYMVAHNVWLKQMARSRPTTPTDLLNIKGFGEKRVSKYGGDLIAILIGLYRLAPSAADDHAR